MKRILLLSFCLLTTIGQAFSQTLDIETSSNFTLGDPYKAIFEVGGSLRFNHLSVGAIYTVPIEQCHWRINFLGIKSKIYFRDQSKKFNVYVENSSSIQIGKVKDNFWINESNTILRNVNQNDLWYSGELKTVKYLGYFGLGTSLNLSSSFRLGLAFGFTRFSWRYSYRPYFESNPKFRNTAFWTGGPVLHLTYSIPVGKKKE